MSSCPCGICFSSTNNIVIVITIIIDNKGAIIILPYSNIFSIFKWNIPIYFKMVAYTQHNIDNVDIYIYLNQYWQ